MNKKQQIEAFSKVADRLIDLFDNVSHNNYGGLLFSKVVSEERDHRNFVGGSYGLSVFHSSKLFVAQNTIEFILLRRKTLEVRDYLNTRKSLFMVCSLVENYRKEIEQCLQGLDIEEVLTFDYAELVKV